MALKDVKLYYYNVLNQYLEMKENLKDFDEALQAGFITEDQLAAVKEDIGIIEQNYNRLSYIMYLLELPQREKKRPAFNRRNIKLIGELNPASDKTILDENKSVLDHLRVELKRLKDKNDDK